MIALSKVTGGAIGYVSSGRFIADIHKDASKAARYQAHLAFRWGDRTEGRTYMRRALREWKNYRWYLSKVIQ